jgi:hypothetical protein
MDTTPIVGSGALGLACLFVVVRDWSSQRRLGRARSSAEERIQLARSTDIEDLLDKRIQLRQVVFDRIVLELRADREVHMRRNSAKAREMVEMLAKDGIEVTPRRLERWGQDGLAPLPGEPQAQALRHYGLLAELSGAGEKADRIAILLAARGHRCTRLRKVLLALTDPGPQGNAEVPDPDSDPGFELIEKTAAEYMASPIGSGFVGGAHALEPLLKVFEQEMAAARTARRHSYDVELQDDETGREVASAEAAADTLEVVKNDFATNILLALCGGEIYDHSFRHLLEYIPEDTMRMAPQIAHQWVKEASDAELAEGVFLWRRVLPLALPGTDPERLDLIAQGAPFLLGIVGQPLLEALIAAATQASDGL